MFTPFPGGRSMGAKQVRKRDGTLVPFDRRKIEGAIQRVASVLFEPILLSPGFLGNDVAEEPLEKAVDCWTRWDIDGRIAREIKRAPPAMREGLFV